MSAYVTIQNIAGEQMNIPLSRDGRREVGTLLIDGIPYHVERLKVTTMMRVYRIDTDKNYTPQRDRHGMCVVVAPFSER